jgi:hypothetical protein
MTRPAIYLDPAIARCLAHGLDGRPNGCDLADDCLRHLAISSPIVDGQTMTVARRACCADYDKLISRSTLDGDAA